MTAAAATAAALGFAPAAALAAAPQSDACEALRSLASPALRIDSAEPLAADATAPARCRLRATLNPRNGAGGQSFGMGFELNLPAAWNGRFLFQGGGGLDGVIGPALGQVGPGFPSALARGFAVVSTDAGHQGRDAAFATDQQARLDYAYNALDKVTLAAKDIVARYYGRPIDRSYFMGCSNGGRQGMMAVSRMPAHFDGVIAGNPGFNLTNAAIAQAWETIEFAKVAPKAADGRPIIAAAFSPEDMKLVSDGVLAACDDKDGLKDGMINAFKGCRYDPKALTCKGAKTAACLTAAQVKALAAVFGGPRTSSGQAIYSTWPYDAGVADMGWRAWKLGTSTTGQPNSLHVLLGFDSLTRYFTTPPALQMDPYTFDFDKDVARTRETAAINDPTGTYLSTFAGRGKLIVYQGVSDPVFSADDIMGWYDRMSAANGGDATGFARLFMVPGMNHCAGGPATDQFDALAALQAWVEQGVAPERIVATGKSFPGVSRPLCPYPKVARFDGGDAKDEKSFSCR
jgi:feruloyl esterase